MATKRMSHKNCKHPATSHERAKCKAKRTAQEEKAQMAAAEVGMNTTGDGMSIGQLANLLASSLDSLRYAEARVEEHQRNAEMAQEALTREMLSREPKPNTAGQTPVVAFSKRYSKDKSGKLYDFVAVGIAEEHVTQNPDSPYLNIYQFRQMWYVSAGRRTIAPMPWAELVKFMGLEGLKTLEVLRGV
ncbi:hypothetical protein SEA_BEAVER_82 [Gordonia phage Beaver]|uniref:Uncharacterized protein n=1 Tax=Gordonia phage Beaver TaxID=2591111 RepID=A0A515MJQ1_9CAUD|nr:hypothetical protein HWC39_gp052 [Gordonia phage Beaver]QDM56896.1 hypothetical protein SEA_BEAVER_82 [Gordonia phage Beaver]